MSPSATTAPTGRGRAAIAAWVERRVAAGELRADDRLPTVRDLADELAVSTATVAAAYRELADRGVTIGRGRSGTFVAPRARPRHVRRPAGAIDLVDLALGGPDPDLLPDLAPHLARLDLPGTSYGSPAVLPSLQAVAPDVLPRPGPATTASSSREAATGATTSDDLLVTSGALDAIERALSAWLRPGDAVAVEDPGWTALFDLLTAMRLRTVPVAVDVEGPSPAALASVLDDVKAVVVTPRFQNPTGAALSSSRAEDLRDVLDGSDLLYLEDDHAGLVAGAPLHTLTGSTSRWLYVQSVSKSLGPDLRVALSTADGETAERVGDRLSVGPGWVSTILQALVASVLGDDATPALLDRATTVYTGRRSTLVTALADRGIEATAPSGLNVWVPVHDEASVVASAQAGGFAILAGQRFRHASPSAVRISVGNLETGSVDALADAIGRAVGRPRSSMARTA